MNSVGLGSNSMIYLPGFLQCPKVSNPLTLYEDDSLPDFIFFKKIFWKWKVYTVRVTLLFLLSTYLYRKNTLPLLLLQFPFTQKSSTGSYHHSFPLKQGNPSLPLAAAFWKIYSHNRKVGGNYVEVTSLHVQDSLCRKG